MKVEIDSENLLTLRILAAVLQTDVATVANDCIGWHLRLPLGNRGVTFLAEEIAGWPFDSEKLLYLALPPKKTDSHAKTFPHPVLRLITSL
jgi:hypothetical protein